MEDKAGQSRRDRKRARSSFTPHNRTRQPITQPFLGFQNIKLSPSSREQINIDERFFPFGINPGSILEIKGPEKSGKTFLLTYIIARLLVLYPKKKVLFVNTRHKLDMKNLILILAQTETKLYNSLGGSREAIREYLSTKSVSDIFKNFPQFLPYFNRILVLECFSAEDLLLTVGPLDDSVMQKCLLQDKDIALVAVDSIDNFSFSEHIQNGGGGESSNVMKCLKNAVSATRCPVICTTLIPADKHEYFAKKQNGSGSNSATNECPAVGMQLIGQLTSNFAIDYTVFTKILELSPVADSEKAKIKHRDVKKITHCVNAYLRSRQSANTAGSGGNHRVKFSIFSDMLWVM